VNILVKISATKTLSRSGPIDKTEEEAVGKREEKEEAVSEEEVKRA